MRTRTGIPRTWAGVAVVATALLTGVTALSGCGSTDPKESSRTITIATHDSWAMSKSVMAEFTRKTGITVRITRNGDVGELTSKLVLSKGDPFADGFFGVDNTFATRVSDAGIVADYPAPGQAASAARFALSGTTGKELTPIDYGDVCVNVDNPWFARHHLAPPVTLDDLAAPQYKGLTVTPGAQSSSTGLAFLLATIGRYGDGWKAYWAKLVANDIKIDVGWTQAYESDFTAGGGRGDRPIVVSYSSSPPDTVPQGATKPTTSALLDTCFRQVEYAGVLKGAANPKGMEEFIRFMIGRRFQAAMPAEMYVYPVDSSVPLPADWSSWAPVSPKPYVVTPAAIAAHRSEWLQDWADITSR
ncbi:MAG: transporter, periplasmic binding protein thiB subfamily [Marmoricola sp.]|nr:transporter, periplasmic binding protein thiB subfamily [Marmoricola sp.]